MYASQFIFITIILFIIYKTLRSYQKKYISKHFLFVWLVFWCFVLFVLLDQELLAQMAQILGIGRGVDLAVYTSVIVLFYLIYILLIKIQELERKITNLIRNESLEKAQKSNRKKP